MFIDFIFTIQGNNCSFHIVVLDQFSGCSLLASVYLLPLKIGSEGDFIIVYFLFLALLNTISILGHEYVLQSLALIRMCQV